MARFTVKLSIATACLFLIGIIVSLPAFSRPPSQNEHSQHVKHPHCPRLVWEGNYLIDDLEDIEDLSGYTDIEGTLLIRNVSSLKGLECLRYVGGGLSIWAAPGLENLEGLDNLETVGSLGITTDHVDSLTSLKGLENLKYIKGNLSIISIDGLRNLEGLDNLRTIGQSLTFEEANGLENLRGLGRLQSVNKIFFSNQDGPYNFEGIGKIESIRYLGVSGVSHLSSFKGLDSLKYITGKLTVSGNKDVTSLDGLENLRVVGDDFTFTGNDALCNSLIEQLRDQTLDPTGISGTQIDDNKNC